MFALSRRREQFTFESDGFAVAPVCNRWMLKNSSGRSHSWSGQVACGIDSCSAYL